MGGGGVAPFLVEMFEDGRNCFVAGKGELEVGVQALFTCDVRREICTLRRVMCAITCFFTNAPDVCDAGMSCTISFVAEDEKDDVDTQESEDRVRVRGKWWWTAALAIQA